MPSYTENLNLEKPLESENYDVDVFNGNADKIDAEFGKPITASKIADNAIITSKLVNGAVTPEKLAAGYISTDYNGDLNELKTPGMYKIIQDGTIDQHRPADVNYLSLLVMDAGSSVIIQLAAPVSNDRLYIRGVVGGTTSQWTAWVEIGALADGSITTAKLADEAVTGDKIADGAVTADKLATDVIPSELPADKLLAGAGGRAMQATPYAIRPTESVLRIRKDTAGMPPKTISIPLLSTYPAGTPCSLCFEARAVSGSTASLSPAGNSDAGFIGSWTTSGSINDGDWASFSVEDKTGFTGLSILLSSDQAASVDFRNVRVVDAAGNDYVDHTTFEAQGTVTEVFPDTTETDNTDIPTVAGVKALLSSLEARIADLEGGGA